MLENTFILNKNDELLVCKENNLYSNQIEFICYGNGRFTDI